MKTDMKVFEVRAPQVYRYQCPQLCGETHRLWHYSVAGVPAAAAERLFESVGPKGISVSFNGTDMVLPPFNVHEAGAREGAVALGMGAKGVGA